MSLNFDEFEYIDISPPISEKIGVFPGDTKFKREKVLSYDNNDHLEVSSIATTVHLGAHVDAPIHYHKNGESIDKRNLSFYMGPCQVIEVKNKAGGCVELDDLLGVEIKTSRILFKTNSFPDCDNWNEDFMAISPAVIKSLAEKKVKLVGIDTPSIDPQNSKNLSSHHEVYKFDMAILEGIILKDVIPGKYSLMALPLKLVGADASPVRAILIKPKGRA